MAPLPPSNGKTVLITGINGYIASVLGHLVLTKGYSLRGSSRSLASSDALLKGAYADYSSRVEIVEVPDMTTPGCFDKAVVGVHAIFHTASPIGLGSYTYENMIMPAVAGTETLLNSAFTHAGSQLASVVVTSSTATVYEPKPDGEAYVFTEKDVANTSAAAVEQARKEGKDPPAAASLYAASKTLAERAVWRFRDEKKPPFALSTVHPTVTVGPPVQPPADPQNLNVTLKPVWATFSGGWMPSQIGSGSAVDVRDVATMHLWAAEHPEKADGERYIGCFGFGPVQAMVDVLREAYPERRGVIQEGKPGEGYVGFEDGVVKGVDYLPGRPRVSGKKAETEMGFKFRPFKESILDTAKVFERYL